MYPISENDLWRFVIDGNRQVLGPNSFDIDEPGYLNAASSAFKYILHNFHLKFSLKLLLDLHHRVTHKVLNNAGLRQYSVSFGLNSNTLTLDGLIEIYNYWIDNYQIYIASERSKYKIILSWRHLTIKYAKGETLYYINRRHDISTQLIKIIDTYHSDITTASDQYEIFHAIMKCAHHIDLVHPFADGNIRTCWLVVNLLLMQNNYPPVIFDDPNKLDGYSTHELVHWLDRSMCYTSELFGWRYTSFHTIHSKLSIPPFKNNLEVRLKRKRDDIEVDDIIHNKRIKLTYTRPTSSWR